MFRKNRYPVCANAGACCYRRPCDKGCMILRDTDFGKGNCTFQKAEKDGRPANRKLVFSFAETERGG